MQSNSKQSGCRHPPCRSQDLQTLPDQTRTRRASLKCLRSLERHGAGCQSATTPASAIMSRWAVFYAAVLHSRLRRPTQRSGHVTQRVGRASSSWSGRSSSTSSATPQAFLPGKARCKAARERLGSAAASLSERARAWLAYSSIPVDGNGVATGNRWRASLTRPSTSRRVVEAASPQHERRLPCEATGGIMRRVREPRTTWPCSSSPLGATHRAAPKSFEAPAIWGSIRAPTP